MTESASSRGAETPLVSVIVRTTGRPELAEALSSVASQTFRPLEIILVDARGQGLPSAAIGQSAGDVPVIKVSTESPLSRPQAANRGLDACNGNYLLFLDEDDWIAPEHIGGLVNVLSNQTDVKAVYSSTRKVDAAGNPLDTVFDYAYDPDLLKRDNYIPIHAMLFEQSLIHAGCRFDESLDIYEDWDFWLQLALQTAFLHVDQLSAFYRQGGASATDEVDDAARFRDGHPLAEARSRLYSKWISHWGGAGLNRLIGNTVTSSEFTSTVTALHKQLQNSARQLSELDEVAGSLRVMLNQSTRETEVQKQEVQSLRKAIQRLTRENALSDLHKNRNIQDLETRLNQIYRLPSWRLMGPFRRAKRLVDNSLLFPIKRRIHFWKYGTELAIGSDSGTGTGLPRGVSLIDDEPTAAGQDEQTKGRYREEAEEHLTQLLNSSNSLPFPRSEKPRLSILLVLYNQAALTLLCLESILKFAPAPYEVVIVDNASADATDQLLDKLSNVTIIRNTDNLGFVTAVNQGLEQCRGHYLLLLNNDALLHLFAVESAIDSLETTAGAGAVGGRILLLDGSLQEAGSIIYSDGSCLGYGRHGSADAPEFMFRRPVDYCSAAFLLCKTDLFRQMDGFDTDYVPAYYEDSDFCVRLQKAGLKVIYDPAAVITHYEFASSGGQEKAGLLQEQHRQILREKHSDYLSNQPAVSVRSPLFSRTANDYPNILVIDDCVPHASLGSGYPRSRQIISLLAGDRFNVSLYPLQFPDESWEATYRSLPRDVEVMLKQGTAGLADFLRRRQGFFDMILVSRIHNMQALNEVLAGQPQLLGDARLVYDAEAITAPRDIMRRELQGEVIAESEKFSLVEQEISAARTADTIIAVSAIEAGIYQQHGFANTVVLGHSLATRPTVKPVAERDGLLFVGALREEDSPNVDSLHWFVTEVWPLIRKTEPAMTLQVVGNDAARSLQSLRSDGIVFRGRLDDLQDVYNNARVFIAPTRFAAGIPHKVHEAAAFGVPCVTTTLLARQLDWQHGCQLLAADSPQDFADSCLSLYRDPDQWQAVRRSALEAVERDCSPDRFREVLLELLRESGTEKDFGQLV